jgi:methanogenic corrinoid protein MtbC1
MDRFEEVLDQFIAAKGIDRAIHYLVFPFLDKIGILWLTNNIHPAQEHLVTNIIRQKLIVGIESVVSHLSPNKKVILFLPEGEHHELGLLYIYYLLKSRGVQVIYLGANVPISDLEFITLSKKPDFVYTHLTCITGNFNYEKYLHQVHESVHGIPLVISGQLARNCANKPPAGVHFKKSLPEVLEFIAAI